MTASDAIAAGGTAYAVLEGGTEIDRVIFSRAPFALAAADQATLRVDLARTAIEWHLERCPLYAAYADKQGFRVENIQEETDLTLVPQLPTGLYKRAAIVTEGTDRDAAKRCTSSGTRGSVSVVWRDRPTIQRLLGSVQAGVREFLDDPFEDDVEIINLGPDQSEAGDLWFAYVLSLVELGYSTTHMTHDGQLDAKKAAETVTRAREDASVVVVIGSPAQMHDVAQEAGLLSTPARNGSGRVIAITAGGWKRLDGARVARSDVAKAVMEGLGVTSPHDLRDMFNQVELNTVIFECEHGAKHLPPWLHAFTRDPYTMQPLSSGERGLLSYVDPSATSYPAFVIGDDLGVVEDGRCPCGRVGKTLQITRRITRNEQWGCALKMASAAVDM